MKPLSFLSVLLLLLAAQVVWGQIPQTMSYQGVLTDAAGDPVQDGDYNLTFKLYASASTGTELWTETQTPTIVNGIFNVILGRVNPLDLPFDKPYWLGITVAEGSELTPRVELTASAYSLNARSIEDSLVTGNKIAKGQVVRSINSLRDDVTLAAGDNVTITQVDDTLKISSSAESGEDNWQLSGNSGTDENTHFLGTTDEVALNFRVNNSQAFRLEPGSHSPNVVGGYSANRTLSGVEGAHIGGGGRSGDANLVTDSYGTIGGGRDNQAGDDAGTKNDRGYATVGGGMSNIASGEYATVPGGEQNTAAGNNSFAAGTQAKASHDGSFVWGDKTAEDFESTDENQFLIRAEGGVGIGKNNPAAALDVAGGVHSDSTKTNDLVVEGAYKGSIGPNNGAPFPRPAYDSGWTSINQGQTLLLNHNIGGNPDDYVVDLQFRHGSFGPHIISYGTIWIDGGWRGTYWNRLTNSQIEVRRLAHDDVCEEIRVRIWVYN